MASKSSWSEINWWRKLSNNLTSFEFKNIFIEIKHFMAASVIKSLFSIHKFSVIIRGDLGLDNITLKVSKITHAVHHNCMGNYESFTL